MKTRLLLLTAIAMLASALLATPALATEYSDIERQTFPEQSESVTMVPTQTCPSGYDVKARIEYRVEGVFAGSPPKYPGDTIQTGDRFLWSDNNLRFRGNTVIVGAAWKAAGWMWLYQWDGPAVGFVYIESSDPIIFSSTISNALGMRIRVRCGARVRFY